MPGGLEMTSARCQGLLKHGALFFLSFFGGGGSVAGVASPSAATSFRERSTRFHHMLPESYLK